MHFLDFINHVMFVWEASFLPGSSTALLWKPRSSQVPQQLFRGSLVPPSFLNSSFVGSLVLAKVGEVTVLRPIAFSRTVSETTGNKIPARPYTLPLFLKLPC